MGARSPNLEGMDQSDKKFSARILFWSVRSASCAMANEILRKASAYFAQAELDRRFKP